MTKHFCDICGRAAVQGTDTLLASVRNPKIDNEVIGLKVEMYKAPTGAAPDLCKVCLSKLVTLLGEEVANLSDE